MLYCVIYLRVNYGRFWLFFLKLCTNIFSSDEKISLRVYLFCYCVRSVNSWSYNFSYSQTEHRPKTYSYHESRCQQAMRSTLREQCGKSTLARQARQSVVYRKCKRVRNEVGWQQQSILWYSPDISDSSTSQARNSVHDANNLKLNPPNANIWKT